MRVTSVSAEFRRTVSDRNYGNESAQAAMTAEIEEGEDLAVAQAALLAECRAQVFTTLSNSPSLQVRLSLRREERSCYECHQPMEDFEPGQMHQACREAREARQKEADERWQRRQTQPLDDEDDGPRSDPDDHGDADEDLEDLPV